MYEQYMLGNTYYREAIPNMSTIAGAKEYIKKQGADNDVLVIELYTGSGLSFCIYPERGMDIGECYYNGAPIAFVSKAGIKNPKNISQTDFSRYFFGGMVTTCGLDNVGGGCLHNDEYYPGHGRLNLTPAEDYHIEKYWSNGQYIIEVKGQVRSAALFGENLVLRRSIKIKAGESKIYLQDEIINEGFVPAGYMLLYHCNFGFPVVSPDSYVVTNHRKIDYLDESSQEQGKVHTELQKPVPGLPQSAFILSDVPQRVKAAVYNDKIKLGVSLECNSQQLGKFCEWMNLASQDYVIGLEPAKNLPEGRLCAEENNRLNWLEPGKTDRTELEFEVISGEYAQQYCEKIRAEQER